MSRTIAEKMERSAWWRRKPWPAVVLGVDPAADAGAAISLPMAHLMSAEHRMKVPSAEALLGYGEECVEVERELVITQAFEVATETRAVERTIELAATLARRLGLQLVVALEDWGSGGRLGIKQWLGMGAAAGAWTRAVKLAAAEEYRDVLATSRCIIRVQQVRWRSWMVDESGDRSSGKFKPFDSDGWKKAATSTIAARFPYLRLEGANSAEAALVAAYTARSDELGRLLPVTYLRQHGHEPLPPEPEKAPKKGKKRAGGPRKKRTVEVA